MSLLPASAVNCHGSALACTTNARLSSTHTGTLRNASPSCYRTSLSPFQPPALVHYSSHKP
ncbi:hypothetical protein BU26DRAFT_133086 [Trematosphaeria pertusa]|uniref:Uncharacterized protein n=1 Tax=Trematosphaeria pertusa TaxID=390896 RepID=A0A6A6HYJ3_9PLEO|nr:uncharacterized protein BU26DRAFT_133086 [Trematosphaeria pertusa]KAF2242782.1 hypothetical protein BU26DRAFT_133086 [Trematosphaeria pertusa]